jgi:hypothetical protein
MAALRVAGRMVAQEEMVGTWAATVETEVRGASLVVTGALVATVALQGVYLGQRWRPRKNRMYSSHSVRKWRTNTFRAWCRAARVA